MLNLVSKTSNLLDVYRSGLHKHIKLCSLTQHFHSLVIENKMISNLQLVVRISILNRPAHITFTAVKFLVKQDITNV